MPSLASRAATAALRVAGAKGALSTAQATRDAVAAERLRPARYGPPTRLGDKIDLGVRDVDGWPVYTFGSRGPVSREILYLHGGAYIHQISAGHWRFLAKLLRQEPLRFTVPIYPLAPNGTAGVIVPRVTDLAAGLVADHGAARTVVMGDSAGGGLALATVLALRDRGAEAPARTVLISPWLDIRMTNPGVAATDSDDPFLGTPGLREAGQLYRGDLPADDPMVSPIEGDLRGLGPMTVFSGTADILNADSQRLVRLATEAGVTIDYHEEPDLLHVYPMLPIPEARRARRKVVAALVG